MLKRRRAKPNRRASDKRNSKPPREEAADESVDVALAPQHDTTHPCETCSAPVSDRYAFTQCVKCSMAALKAALEPYYEQKKVAARERFEKMRVDKEAKDAHIAAPEVGPWGDYTTGQCQMDMKGRDT